MPFFNRFGRNRRSGNNHPLFQDEIKQEKSFRNRSVTADYPRAAKPAAQSRVRAASTAHPANKALVAKVISVEKPNSRAVIPDVIPSQESQASVQVVNAQINAATTKYIQESTTKHTQEPVYVLKDRLAVGNDRKKRANSFTNSESEAVGTLDKVLRDFDSIDDNFNEVAQETNRAKTMNDDIFTDETRYDSISKLKEKELAKNDAEEIKTIDYPEHIYAKPIKLNSKPTTPTEKSEINVGSILNPFEKNEPEEGPAVPPKLFSTEEFQEHEIKFSELRKTSSMSLSQSLKETDWDNSNAEIPSPNRRPYPAMDSNNNYSLKRGKLSAPNESTEDYIKPPPDYDVNSTMSSIGKSMSISDDSFTRDNFMGSLSSSSGSQKEAKPIRPEVLDLIRGKKSEQAEGDAKKGPEHDGLVKRSFRLIRQASLKKDCVNESPETDYVAIKNEADKWLANNVHLRANSPPAKNNDSTATNSSASHGSPKRKVPVPENRSVKPKDVSLKSDSAPLESNQNGSFKSESKSLKKQVSLDDENLVRLMETGIFPENQSSVVNGSPDPGWTYVPRALRMSYGPSWDGIRKDRRAWKSREINTPTYQNARKGSKKLSSRLDDKSQQLEMLF